MRRDRRCLVGTRRQSLLRLGLGLRLGGVRIPHLRELKKSNREGETLSLLFYLYSLYYCTLGESFS